MPGKPEREDQKKLVKDFFSEDALAYFQSYQTHQSARSFSFQRRRKLVLELLPLGSGKILDIGSGPGVYTSELLERGYEIWTIDISEQMVDLARKTFENHPQAHLLHFQVGDIENLEFPENFFDALLCVGVLEYLESPDQAIREMARVLKPSAVAVITGPNGKSLIYQFNRAFAGLANFLFGPFLKRLRGRKFFDYGFPHQVFDPKQLEEKLQRAGFTIQARRYSNYQIGLLRGPLRRWNERLSIWAEENLIGSRWERLGTNYMVLVKKR